MLTAQTYARNPLDTIEVVRYQFSDTNLDDVMAWLNANVPGHTAEHFGRLGSLLIKRDGTPDLLLSSGENLVRDGQNKLYRVTQDLLSLFWGPAV